ncbi:MAG: hypothetical protein R2856_00475 [Caldilineaceae bacterium]
MRSELQPLYQAHRVEIDKAAALATVRYQEDEVHAAEAVSQTVMPFILIGVIVAAASGGMAFFASAWASSPHPSADRNSVKDRGRRHPTRNQLRKQGRSRAVGRWFPAFGGLPTGDGHRRHIADGAIWMST